MYDQEWDASEYYEGPEQQVDPRVENLLNHYEHQQAEAAYESEMDRLVSQHPGLRPELMHSHVVAADGDFNLAYQIYENYVEATQQAYVPPAEEEPSEATPVSGQSLGDAIDSWIATERGK